MSRGRVVLNHERLEVYHVALEMIEDVDRLAAAFGGVRRHLGWQLHKAATSILLNIAEGSGRYRPDDKAQFYVIATGSAAECAAILDIARRLRIGDPATLDRIRSHLESITRMLIALSRRTRSS